MLKSDRDLTRKKNNTPISLTNIAAKSPQQNISNSNFKMCKQNYTPQPSEIYYMYGKIIQPSKNKLM